MNMNVSGKHRLGARSLDEQPLQNKAHGFERTIAQPKAVLAILTHEDHTRQFRGDLSNFRDLLKVGQEAGVLVFVMTTKSAYPLGNHVWGYTYDAHTRRWRRRLFPMPHVVYNRIPFRKFENLPLVTKLLHFWRSHPNVHLFNRGFFNKWQLYQWLSQNSRTSRYIPPTRKLRGLESFMHMLELHSNVYLKPIGGKAGKGIMQVEQLFDNETVANDVGSSNTTHLTFSESIDSVHRSTSARYRLKRQYEQSSTTRTFSTIEKLWNCIEKEIDNRAYIIQTAIRLAQFQDRVFDLRVLAQKNGAGRWQISGLGARLAGLKSITTHVPRGGSIESPEWLLGQSFGESHGKKIMERAKRTALRIAKHIEMASGDSLGEMSMDIGIDVQGDIWLFEANAKPMKFDEPLIRARSLQSLLAYVHYLSQTPKAGASDQ